MCSEEEVREEEWSNDDIGIDQYLDDLDVDIDILQNDLQKATFQVRPCIVKIHPN